MGCMAFHKMMKRHSNFCTKPETLVVHQHSHIAYVYYKRSSVGGGGVVSKDNTMWLVKYYWKLAAMKGHTNSRYNLGIYDEYAGNMSRATKHYTIAAGLGDDECLNRVHKLFIHGHAGEDDLEKALYAYEGYVDMSRSEQIDSAPAS